MDMNYMRKMEKMKVGDFTWKDDVKSYFFTFSVTINCSKNVNF